jgi:hypothetical protein
MGNPSKLLKLWNEIRPDLNDLKAVCEIMEAATAFEYSATPASLDELSEILAGWLFVSAHRISYAAEQHLRKRKEVPAP